MKPNPVVEEIRKVRDAHAAKYDCDLAAICQDLRKREDREVALLVKRQPKVRLKKAG